jgi:4-hydroxy-tetrahydrodipicolinate reductase
VKPIRVAVNGALGRMGARILALAAESGEYAVAGAFEAVGNAEIGKETTGGVRLRALTPDALKEADVLIDFSSPEGARKAAAACLAAGKALVVGTTGLEEAAVAEIRKAAEKIPVVLSPNMSVGANFLFELVRAAAQKLGDAYDIEIVESHHRLKKDAPSGTAKKIADVIAEAKRWDLADAARYGRQGITGERSRREVGIHVVRAGDIVGEHTVIFGGPGETIELKHTALSRDAFARGALVAAAFAAKQGKGLYSMGDVLR